jgi:hypothetical protein
MVFLKKLIKSEINLIEKNLSSDFKNKEEVDNFIPVLNQKKFENTMITDENDFFDEDFKPSFISKNLKTNVLNDLEVKKRKLEEKLTKFKKIKKF